MMEQEEYEPTAEELFAEYTQDEVRALNIRVMTDRPDNRGYLVHGRLGTIGTPRVIADVNLRVCNVHISKRQIEECWDLDEY